MSDRYDVVFTAAARRALHEKLPLAVAVAASELIYGALTEEPYRLGAPLDEPFKTFLSARRGEYRVIYRVDDPTRTVTIWAIRHRRDAYRR